MLGHPIAEALHANVILVKCALHNLSHTSKFKLNMYKTRHDAASLLQELVYMFVYNILHE